MLGTRISQLLAPAEEVLGADPPNAAEVAKMLTNFYESGGGGTVGGLEGITEEEDGEAEEETEAEAERQMEAAIGKAEEALALIELESGSLPAARMQNVE